VMGCIGLVQLRNEAGAGRSAFCVGNSTSHVLMWTNTQERTDGQIIDLYDSTRPDGRRNLRA
jgi:hypothetical protein